ncbi:lipase family protein [Corynebacterium aquatimens]|uniref:Pimeloyl-ACP methyl ester carboxylesterase n=1 Tax=Corynebacterium aquatimens TaxID=1190508 RepID=A0A931DYY9_9CORY|nr:lipase family protein [Corynebacterium aquatimens]MBG6122675.1 pimeloyl-ACP methyl ester carboxylesterase [Corynebacterium aquatimens]
MLSALALTSGFGAPVAAAQSSGPSPFGSAADLTHQSSVKTGESMRPVAQRTKPIYRSDLPEVGPSSRVGEVLAKVPLDPRAGLDNAGEQVRFAYTTVDQHGQPAVSTGAMYMPKGQKPAGGWPVIAWAHGTVGLGDECAPSINPQVGNDARYLNKWLDEGYAIVATDYVGLDSPGLHSYLNGKVSAANVVDSVAAAHEMFGGELSKKWAVVGQSQGGGVALHVARRATPLSEKLGLDYRGAVATGAPAYIEEIVIAAGPTFPPMPLPGGLSVFGLYILAAVQEAHPEIDMDAALSDEGRFMLAEAKKSCFHEVRDGVQGVNLARAFTKPLRSVPGLDKAIREFMATPTSGYDKPVFVGHGLKDMDVPSPIGMLLNTEMWFNQFFGMPRNTRVDVKWYLSDHGTTPNVAFPDSSAFLAEIFRD